MGMNYEREGSPEQHIWLHFRTTRLRSWLALALILLSIIYVLVVLVPNYEQKLEERYRQSREQFALPD